MSRANRGKGVPHKLTPRDYAIYCLKEMQVRDRQALLENRACAEAGLNDTSYGRLEWSILPDHHAMLTLLFPDLISRDMHEKKKAYEKLRKEPIAQIYRINPKEQMR